MCCFFLLHFIKHISLCVCVCVMGSWCPTFRVLWWRCGPDRSDRLRWAAGTLRPGEDRKAWGILGMTGRQRRDRTSLQLLQRGTLNTKLVSLINKRKKCAFIFLSIHFNSCTTKPILIQNLHHHNDSAVPRLRKCRSSPCPPSMFMPLLISTEACCTERPKWAAERAE